MLDLYHWEPNAESLALLICLKEKKLDFDSHYVDLLKLEHHAADYLELSPKALVPLLIADGESMSDTGFALQYLAERYQEPRYAPSDPSSWYDLQAWTGWLGGMMGLSTNVRLLGWNYVMLGATPENDLAEFRAGLAELPQEKRSGWAAVWSDAEANEDQLANAEHQVQEVIAKIDNLLANAQWVVGGDYSIVDMYAFALIHSLPNLLPGIVNQDSTPNVIDWIARVAVRPAVIDAQSMRRSTLAPTLYAAPGS
jgi:glutathione S-transferase/GST-like protein